MKAVMASSVVRPSAGSKGVSFSPISFAPFLGQTLRRLDVPGLGLLVAAAGQDHEGVAPPLEVDPIAWAVVDAQLADTFADRFRVTRMSVGQAIQPGEDHTEG